VVRHSPRAWLWLVLTNYPSTATTLNEFAGRKNLRSDPLEGSQERFHQLVGLGRQGPGQLHQQRLQLGGAQFNDLRSTTFNPDTSHLRDRSAGLSAFRSDYKICRLRLWRQTCTSPSMPLRKSTGLTASNKRTAQSMALRQPHHRAPQWFRDRFPMFTPLAPCGQGYLNPRNRGCKCGIGFGGPLRCHILARRLPRRSKRRHTRWLKQRGFPTCRSLGVSRELTNSLSKFLNVERLAHYPVYR
jgi:hypothetical protein